MACQRYGVGVGMCGFGENRVGSGILEAIVGKKLERIVVDNKEKKQSLLQKTVHVVFIK